MWVKPTGVRVPWLSLSHLVRVSRPSPGYSAPPVSDFVVDVFCIPWYLFLALSSLKKTINYFGVDVVASHEACVLAHESSMPLVRLLIFLLTSYLAICLDIILSGTVDPKKNF